MKKAICVKLDDDLLKKLDDISSDFGVTRTAMLCMMISFFLKSQNK